MSVEPLYTADGKAMTPSRACVFLKRLIVVLRWAGVFFLVFFSLVFLGAVLAGLGVEPVKNRLPDDISPTTILFSSLSMIIGTCVFLIILKQLRLICDTLVRGDPFVPANAGRLRVIWIAVAAAEILRLVSAFVMSYLIARDQGTGMGEITFDLRIYVWFLILALSILSEIFREGARLRREQKLTV